MVWAWRTSVTNGTRITATSPTVKIPIRMIFVQFELGDATTSWAPESDM